MSPLRWNLAGIEESALAARFEVLVDWVSWLTERYGLQRVIPQCWWRHPPMVEELNALETAWAAAYEGISGDDEAPLRFHEDLAKTLGRLAGWDQVGCGTSGHRESRRSPAAREEPSARCCAQLEVATRRLKRHLRQDGDSWNPETRSVAALARHGHPDSEPADDPGETQPADTWDFDVEGGGWTGC